MPRTVRNAKIDTRSARVKLAVRREPHWTVISTGCAIGYRRGAKGGTWIARWRGEDGKQRYEALGAADDIRDADGSFVRSFPQAQEAARVWFSKRERNQAGHEPEHRGVYTVAMALADYFAAREQRGSKGVSADRSVASARIEPELGNIDIDRLTTKRIRDWHSNVAKAPKIVRTRRGSIGRATKPYDLNDPEAVRARRSSANRQLTVLKAALNHAFSERHAASDAAWRIVKPFREADVAVVRYLSTDEVTRLVEACQPTFRDLVCGALVTGCRYGELTRMVTADFNAGTGMVTIRISKAGKPRHVALNAEGQLLFATLTAGRGPRDLIFRRSDGSAWAASHQQRPLALASDVAKLDPPATFHILRHTYASALAVRGVPIGVIRDQLGHSDSRMTERHYAHLAPGYVAETIRSALPGFGVF